MNRHLNELIKQARKNIDNAPGDKRHHRILAQLLKLNSEKNGDYKPGIRFGLADQE